MIDFVKTNLTGITATGELSQSERMWILGGGAAVLVLAAWLIRKLVLRRQRRKNAIFSNSKNKYKSRLGKKNIKY